MEKEIEKMEIMTTEEDMDKNNNEDRRYYIYEHIRKDNNTCFYVGKGTGDRAYNLDRGNFHNGVRDEYGCRVKIIKDGLTEKEAFALERERITDYVITFGWGAPIDGYRDFSNNYLTNFTWGGEGTSGMNAYANKTPEEMEEIGKKISEKNKGRNAFENKTPEEMEEIRRKMSEKNKGKNNPMYGKNPYANKTPEEMEEIRRKMSESHKGNNPYANKTSEEMEEIANKKSKAMKGKNAGEKNGMCGKPAPNRSKVVCITTCKIFDCIKDAEKYYSCSNISACCRVKSKYAGKLKDGTLLQWKYLKDYDNDCKGILINPIITK